MCFLLLLLLMICKSNFLGCFIKNAASSETPKKLFSEAKWFQHLILAFILLAAVGVGLETYPDIGVLLPAMGYGEQQLKDLEATISSLEYQKVLQARREMRARRDQAARLILRGASLAGEPETKSTIKGVEQHNTNTIPTSLAYQANQSARSVDDSEPSSESDNVAQLRLRRDQAARMIQQQAQKLVTLATGKDVPLSHVRKHQAQLHHRQRNNRSPFQAKPNHGHERLPQKPQTLTLHKKAEHPTPVLRTTLKPTRFMPDKTKRYQS